METITQTPTLLTLPSELRLGILTHLLRSHTGRIGFLKDSPVRTHRQSLILKGQVTKWDDDTRGYSLVTTSAESDHTITLNILRTCKQIYHEAKDLVWNLNTVVFYPCNISFPFEEISKVPSQRLNRLVHIQLDLDFANWDELERVQDIAKTLKSMSEKGCLKKLSIIPARGLWNVLDLGIMRRAPIDCPLGERKLLAKYLQAFNQIQILVPEVERRIMIMTGWQPISSVCGLFDLLSRRSTERLRLLKEGEVSSNALEAVREVLKDLHTAFGGELWQDGKLCYKNAVELSQPFTGADGKIKVGGRGLIR